MRKFEIGLKEKIHFIGIGGIGMSGLAQVMKTMGFNVQGSDLTLSKNVERCKKIGIKVFKTHSRQNINDSSIVVRSTAIKNNNPEIKAAKERKINILKRAEMLAQVVSLKTNIVITGSHGKTTTTSLISKVLTSSGLDPTIINGGVINSFKSSARLGKGEWAVLEADESDGSFLNFPVNYSVITNLDKEHLDYYKSFNNLKKSFIKFLHKTPPIGKCFLCIDDYELRKLIKKINKKNILTYGFSKGANFQILKPIYKKDYSLFNLKISVPGSKNKTIKKIKLNLIGKHNILNSAAAIALSLHIGVKIKIIKNSLKKFSGIQRRLTKVFSIKGREFFDDYAHHPTEIKSVLKSLKATSLDRKLVSVFQPHRYSRLKSLKKDFVSAFKDSDLVVLCPVYSAGEKIDRKYNAIEFAKSISKSSNVQVIIVKNENELKKFFNKNLIENEIVVCMGAGSISKWIREMNL
ncbi:MAG: UDP-N-acetylmuramate--L-alanine ligase [Candidatus Pelagibacter sp.]|nr:UDP-N-acetylmuramate--L-alanine ligase [Candidatus Pelagibacter sp.]|tara:strand:- start:14706 stop:16097 length:1392 start_codon:yes stop_codon:yes gene_type:complete